MKKYRRKRRVDWCKKEIIKNKKMSWIFSGIHNVILYDAINGPDKQRWEKAINDEKKSLEENQTWEIIDIKKLKEEKSLTGKWVFKIKQDGRYKV